MKKAIDNILAGICLFVGMPIFWAVILAELVFNHSKEQKYFHDAAPCRNCGQHGRLLMGICYRCFRADA